MASLVLILLKTPITSGLLDTMPAGAANATFAGFQVAAGLFDALFLFPKLFPPPDVEAARIGDLELAGAEEGAPHNRAFGTIRVPCQLIWQTDLKEVKDASAAGGKGGSGGEFIVYKYFASAMWNVCHNKTARILKLYADGKLLYNIAPDVDYTSNQIEAIEEVITEFTGTRENLILRNSDGTVDLSLYKSGKGLVVSGFTGSAAVNNSSNQSTGEWKVLSARKDVDDPLITEVKVQGNLLPPPLDTDFFSQGPGIDTVTLHQDFPTHKLSQVAAFTFYDGDPEQQPDPLVAKFQTVAPPGNRNRTAVVAEDILLTDFGNRIFNLEALVEVDSAQTVADVISGILDGAGYDASEYDVTGVTGTCRGYNVRGPVRPVSALQPVMLAYDVIARQDGGVLKFYDRTAAPTRAIASTDLAAHEPDSDTAYPWEVLDEAENEVPSELVVKFKDPANEYQTGSRRAFNPNATLHGVETVDLTPIVLSAAEGQALADRFMDARKASRQRIRFSVPFTHLPMHESQVLTTSGVMGESWTLLSRRVERGTNWQMLVEARVEDPDTLTQTEFS